MSLTSLDKIFTVEEQEYGFAAESFRPVASDGKMKVYIPKLMGDIRKVGSEGLVTNSLFDNATECKPIYKTTVCHSNQLEVTIKSNCNWLDKVDENGIVPKGTVFNIEFLNKNISEPYATTK